jgi:hypothetical protein
MAFDPGEIFTALGQLFSFGTALAPALNEWIIARIPEEKQHEMVHRMRQCYRICKREKFNAALIAKQAGILFEDLTVEQRTDITAIIVAELNK